MKNVKENSAIKKRLYVFGIITIVFISLLKTSAYSQIIPVRKVVDLNVGEKEVITISTGKSVAVRLISIKDSVDKINSAVRFAKAEVDVNGTRIVLSAANYSLPVTVGDVQIDCPVTKAYLMKSRHARWKLEKDARLRLWPKDSPLLKSGTFVYPLKQRIFASDTQMGNEPVYVNGGEEPGSESIYYHSGLDFGGFEALEEVVSTVDGIVIISGTNILPDYKDKIPGRLMYDEVMIEDERGWHHGYNHLYSIDSAICPGAKVKMGQRIGYLGKEGVAGGWTHLHYTIKCTQPSGKRGEENAYSYIWEAYVNQYNPEVIAVARPHAFAATGEKVALNGNKTKSFRGTVKSYEWYLSDGITAFGPQQVRIYTKPGTYSEILKISDSKGNIDYDFTVVQVINSANSKKLPPTIHAVYYPTLDIKPGDLVKFGVRTFRTNHGVEKWDFGDGSPREFTRSFVPDDKKMGEYAQVEHRYTKSGHYIVTVERTGENGYTATAHLHVEVK
jgi:murein DD-endopeptidase MepM/ murein hydrolase activator NlpD